MTKISLFPPVVYTTRAKPGMDSLRCQPSVSITFSYISTSKVKLDATASHRLESIRTPRSSPCTTSKSVSQSVTAITLEASR